MLSERYFLAIAIPGEIREMLSAMGEPAPGISWTPVEKLHLTLRFIGEIDEEETVASLVDGLSRIRVGPFILPLEGAGVFPQRGKPRVIWVGVGSGHPKLFQLRQRVDDCLLSLGLEADLRTFHPHVTLARVKSDSASVAATHFAKKRREFVGPAFRADRLELYSSALLSGGSVYSLVAAFPLRD